MECTFCHLYQFKGSEQQGTLVYFSFFFFEKKRETHNLWQFSKYVDFFAKMKKICLKIINSRDPAMILLL